MTYVSNAPLAVRGALPLPLSRAAAKRVTRLKILAAAKSLFSSVGYERATIRDIAAEAGMSTGAVFTNFSGKAELFCEIVVADRAGAYRAIQRTLERALADPGARIEEVLWAMFEAAYRYRVGQLPIIQETISASWSLELGPEVRQRMARRPITDLIARALKTAIERGQIAADADVALLSAMLWTSAISVVPHAVFDRWPLEKLIEQIKAETRVILASSRLKPS